MVARRVTHQAIDLRRADGGLRRNGSCRLNTIGSMRLAHIQGSRYMGTTAINRQLNVVVTLALTGH
jgi:hypothetical protein